MELLLVLVLAVAGAWYFWLRPHRQQSGDRAAQQSSHRNMPAMRPDLSMLPPQFVVFDLETSGLDPERHCIMEIGAIRVNRDSDQHDTFQTLVTPTGRISAKITELTGLNRAMLVADGTPLPEALQSFREFVGELPIVAFNAEFDVAFLEAAARTTGQPGFTNKVSCALKLARRAWPGRRSYRLSALCSDAGISVQSEHRAIPDCERALHVYVAAAQTLGRA